MHLTILISTWIVTQSNTPSVSSILLTGLVVVVVMFAGSVALNRSGSSVRPSDRALSKQVDDKGVPVFFDSGSSGVSADARAACRTRAPRR
jgi:hypothetical protein